MRAFLSPAVIALVLGYTLSQFYRAFLAVLAATLGTELGATPEDLALSSGLWFVVFAAMQIPLGWALDRIGPRRTLAAALGIFGTAGAAVFACATAPWHLHIAMALIGIGCAPAVMAAYYIFAHDYPPAQFGVLAGAIVGFGSAGNILGATPLVWAVQAFGWRESLWGAAALTLAVAALVLAVVRDPRHQGTPPDVRLGDILRLRAIWLMLPLFLVSYASSGGIRGLWAAPYLEQVFGAADAVVGRATLVMGLAMIAGNLLVGPFVRACGGNLRRAVALGHLAGIAALAVLAAAPGSSLALSVVMLGAIGLTGTNYALMMTHGRAAMPAHMVGRGVTFLNMLSVGGVGLTQFASRPVFAAASQSHAPSAAFSLLFLFFLVPLAAGLILYLFAPEPGHA